MSTAGIAFDDRGAGSGLVILNRSVWNRIVELFDSDRSWTEAELIAAVSDDGCLEKQRRENLD